MKDFNKAIFSMYFLSLIEHCLRKAFRDPDLANIAILSLFCKKRINDPGEFVPMRSVNSRNHLGLIYPLRGDYD